MKIVKKIGFYIHSTVIYDHYKNIIKHLGSKFTEVILDDNCKENLNASFINKLKLDAVTIKLRSQVLGVYKYKYLVTNHYMSGNSKSAESNDQYLPCKLGINNIRFMYSFDHGDWSLQKWNELYDIFFCLGKTDSELIKNHFQGDVFTIGYPKYDSYFEDGLKNRKKILSKGIGLDVGKKTIVIFTTVSKYFSTIQSFWTQIIKLVSSFNVIIRPHPLEISPESDRFRPRTLDLINDERIKVSVNPHEELVNLYTIADITICDYGGSIFSSLYLNKNIVLLNNQNALNDDSISNSNSITIRNFIPNYFPMNINHLYENLTSNSYLEKNHEMCQLAREHYFGERQGYKCTVEVVNKLKMLLNNS